MGNFRRGYLNVSGHALQWGVAIASAMSFLVFGYDQGVFGGLIATPQLLDGLKIDPKDANTQGTVVAIYDIGCLLGCLLVACFGMKISRRVFIATGCVTIPVYFQRRTEN